MSSVFEFEAVNRANKGTSAARVTRRSGDVPAVIYGGSTDPEHVVLNHNEVSKKLANEAVYSHILQISVDGKSQNVVLKDLQRHPAKDVILHMDFLRVDMNAKLKVHVPLHFVNQDSSLGVKAGGVITHSMVEVEVACLPAALPEYIEVDMAEVNIGESVHLADLVVTEGVEILALTHGENHNLPVAQVIKTRVPTEDEVSDEAESTEEAASE